MALELHGKHCFPRAVMPCLHFLSFRDTFDSEKNDRSLEAHKYLSVGHHLFDAAKFVMQTAVIDIFRACWTEL